MTEKKYNKNTVFGILIGIALFISIIGGLALVQGLADEKET